MLILSSFSAWRGHEMDCHRRLWSCQLCGLPCNDEAATKAHLLHSHEGAIEGMHVDMLVRASSNPLEAVPAKDCPFCDWDDTLRQKNTIADGHDPVVPAKRFMKHLGRHLEDFALFVFPQPETAEEKGYGENGSNAVHAGGNDEDEHGTFSTMSSFQSQGRTGSEKDAVFDSQSDASSGTPRLEDKNATNPRLRLNVGKPTAMTHTVKTRNARARTTTTRTTITRAAKTRAMKRMSEPTASSKESPQSYNKTNSKTKKPAEGTIQDEADVNIKRVYTPEKLHSIVEEGKSRARKAGKPILAETTEEIYQLSLKSQRLTVLMEAILLQSASTEQIAEFRVYVKKAKKKVREQSKAEPMVEANPPSKADVTIPKERPEKCPVPTCAYYAKGFVRKSDMKRHIFTHYRRTLICSFCSEQRLFRRMDLFKRHLHAVHCLDQTPPNARSEGTCSECSVVYNSAKLFSLHLDGCVLRAISREGGQSEPSTSVVSDLQSHIGVPSNTANPNITPGKEILDHSLDAKPTSPTPDTAQKTPRDQAKDTVLSRDESHGPSKREETREHMFVQYNPQTNEKDEMKEVRKHVMHDFLRKERGS